MATILATFHISKEKDEQGNELEISDEMTNEIVVCVTMLTLPRDMFLMYVLRIAIRPLCNVQLP